MSRTARKLSKLGLYHIMIRGINKQQIFEDNFDYKKFLYITSDYKADCHFKLHAYCIMGNHVHLLLEVSDTPLSEILRRIECRFVYWYNKKYQRTGHLFQDRFRSEIIKDDFHFLRIIRYIQQNPVKAGLCATSEDYPWSSYHAYAGTDDGLTDIQKATSVAGDRKTLLQFFNAFSNEQYLDISTSCRLTDREAREIIYNISQCSSATKFQALSKLQKLSYIKEFKKQGLSIRQISRLCGVSKSIVERAGK